MKPKPLLFGAGIAAIALEGLGAPVMELAAFTASGWCIGYLAKHWQGKTPQPAAALITDEDLRHEILEREHRMQIQLNAAYRNISRFLYAAMYHAMARANTTDPNQLYALARSVYSELNAPFTAVHDVPLEAVIRFCLKHKCLPSPLPENWLEYAPQLAEMAQNMGTTSPATDVSADVSTEQSHVSGNVSTLEPNVSGYEAANVVSLSHPLPLLAALSELKAELGNQAKPAYELYGKWCVQLSNEQLRVRNGREWVRQQVGTLTIKQADTLLKTFKLKAVNDGLLLPNAAYTGKPPHPEYLIVTAKDTSTVKKAIHE